MSWETEAWDAAQAHLEACANAQWDEDGNERLEPTDSPASAPFCGCDTCIAREALYAAYKVIEAGVRAEYEERLLAVRAELLRWRGTSVDLGDALEFAWERLRGIEEALAAVKS